MSYRLEYQWAIFPVHTSLTPATRYLIAIEGGDNNVYNNDTNKRSRRWEVCLLGSATQVLKQAVYLAGACEGGCLKPRGQWCTPEAYIRRIRCLIEKPPTLPPRSHWHPQIEIPVDHPAVDFLRPYGWTMTPKTWYGDTVMTVHIPETHHSIIFRLKDEFPDLAPWRLAHVTGLRHS